MIRLGTARRPLCSCSTTDRQNQSPSRFLTSLPVGGQPKLDSHTALFEGHVLSCKWSRDDSEIKIDQLQSEMYENKK